ncbi:MAG: hypothetical protein AAFR65_02670 [Pseudomonadota bacterium]
MMNRGTQYRSHKRRNAVVAAGLAAAGVFGSQALAANVVVNGTFDDSSAWTGGFVVQPGGTGGFPAIDTGSYYSAGQVATNAITQTYTLSGAELTTLGTTGLDFTMSADLFGFQNQSDNSTFAASFLDASNTELGSASLNSETTRPVSWGATVTAGQAPNFQELTGILPAGTVSIVFTVSAERRVGISNDGYLDNAFFSLDAGDLDPIPVPGAFLLFAPVAAGIAMRRRSRR